MRGCKLLLSGIPLLIAAAGVLTSAADGQKLGRPATPEEIKAVDLSIPPDGTGLPRGQGTATQGEAIFAARCASCHGAKGEGATNDRLVGGVGTLTSNQPVKTVG